jgi:hypothetical protein
VLEKKKDLLSHIQETVVGIDIHPLAVTIAKTNYLLALGDLLKKRLKDYHIPIYLANSLKIPERTGQITTEHKVVSMPVELDHTFVPFPEVFVDHPAAFDEAVDLSHTFALQHKKSEFTEERFRQYAKKNISEIDVDNDTLDTLYRVSLRMRELIDKERNSIWAFILKNVYKPIFLLNRFDWIIGNPPWLTYSDIEKGDYQEFVKRSVVHAYGLLPANKAHLMTHMEIGTLFFCAALRMYGKDDGQIGFVLPRAVFAADQHDNFRKTSFGKAIHRIGLTKIWDLDKVTPLFKVPACVVFGKRPHFTVKPIPGIVVSGEIPEGIRNASLETADKCFTKRKTHFYVIHQGERTFWSEDPKAEFAGSSPYLSKFDQGATIVPRTCWFVQIEADEKLGFNPATPYVKTDKRAKEQAKEAYEDLLVEGTIEKEFLYATLLSTDLLPFGFLEYRPVVLPIKKLKTTDMFTMLTVDGAKEEGYSHLAVWLEYCENEWNRRRKEKAKNESLINWLNYRNKLTQQHYKTSYKVVYPSSATILCGAVVPNEKVYARAGNQKLQLQGFVAESKLYCFETEDEKEANYLSAFLNSPIIDEMIKPMQSKGQWGPRDIHKKIWELPIPGFDKKKSSHTELTTLGITCAEKVAKLIPKLNLVDVTPGKIGRIRNQVREHLNDELKEIDRIVRAIMKK